MKVIYKRTMLTILGFVLASMAVTAQAKTLKFGIGKTNSVEIQYVNSKFPEVPGYDYTTIVNSRNKHVKLFVVFITRFLTLKEQCLNASTSYYSLKNQVNAEGYKYNRIDFENNMALTVERLGCDKLPNTSKTEPDIAVIDQGQGQSSDTLELVLAPGKSIVLLVPSDLIVEHTVID